MKYCFSALVAMLLAGCASQQKNPQEELVMNILTEKLEANAASLFCDQPGYLQCYQITHEQCLLEISDGTEPCFKKANEKFPDLSMQSLEPYGEYIGVCMALKHSLKHGDRLQEIGPCLENSKMDEEQALRSVLK